VDVSGGGLRLRVPGGVVSADDCLVLGFMLGGEHFRLLCRVIRAERLGRATLDDVGAYFERISEAERGRLIRAIYREQRLQLRRQQQK
jgi:hypothetical protein